jgi:hypothetical protein
VAWQTDDDFESVWNEGVMASLRRIDDSSGGSSVAIVTGCGLDGRGSSTRREKRYSLFQSIHTDHESRPISNAMDNEGGGGNFLWVKATGS